MLCLQRSTVPLLSACSDCTYSCSALSDMQSIHIQQRSTYTTLNTACTLFIAILLLLLLLLLQILAGFFGGKSGAVEPIPGTDMYVAIIFSCQEMPDLQRLHAADPSVPIVFFNLKLDTQRGDLGLPAFPPKSLHHTFMCKIKPAFLLRTRGYSKSLARPPYLVNYQGAQFRVYPGAYQSLLDVGTGRYKQVCVHIVCV